MSSGDDERPARSRDRSLATRLAWLVLVGGVSLVIVRASVATVVQIHGDGMAPSIMDGDAVLLLRTDFNLENGDIVVYDPVPAPEFPDEDEKPIDSPRQSGSDHQRPEKIDSTQPSRGELRNAAVVNVQEVEANWSRVQAKNDRRGPRSFRVGRVLAVPGDRVTFNVQGAALGLSINGTPLQQKRSDPMRLRLKIEPSSNNESDKKGDNRALLYATVYEWIDDNRYPVLVSSETADWSGMGLPSELGPVEVRAPGYLVLADNRDEGACCDSRKLGWIAKKNLSGEVVMRLIGDPQATPDVDPRSRRFGWLP